jgi:signal transduction histidine kinase
VKARTLASRLVWMQVSVTLATVAMVGLGTSLTVRALLTRNADQQLHAVTDRVVYYLNHETPEAMDWAWLRMEVEEVRPSVVRIELSNPDRSKHLSAGPSLPLAQSDCASIDSVRACTSRHGPYIIALARDHVDDVTFCQQLDWALGGACALAALLAALGSIAVARRAARPLSDLATHVASLEPGQGQRLQIDTALVEVNHLARRFDELLERFDEVLAREKRFSAEASHELRTPLTVARAEIEQLRNTDRDSGALDRALVAIDRLAALVEALLWFARAQGRLDEGDMDIVNLADVTRSELESLQRVHQGLRLECDLPDEALVRGDEGLLGRVVANLVDNAAKHGDRGTIRVALRCAGSRVTLSVINGGAVIPPKLREQIFLPFVRGAAPGGGGFGLGLPLARAVARSHGGDVRAGGEHDQTEMLLELPLVAWHASPPAASPATT